MARTDKVLRFAVGDPDGARSSEWAISISRKAPDIYVVNRDFAKLKQQKFHVVRPELTRSPRSQAEGSRAQWKASLHASGECHLKLPMIEEWWRIDVSALSITAFIVEVAATELRRGPWLPRSPDTVWLDAPPHRIVAVAIVLSRVPPYQLPVSPTSRRQEVLLEHRLADGRWLEVVATSYPMRREHEELFRSMRRQYLEGHPVSADFLQPESNPRLFVLGRKETAPGRPRCFTELAAIQEPRRDSKWRAASLSKQLRRMLRRFPRSPAAPPSMDQGEPTRSTRS
jgi:hypothetical protein